MRKYLKPQESPQDLWDKLFKKETRRGYCRCGCGKRALPGLRKGRERLYLMGHQQHAKRPSSPPIRISETGCWVWRRSLNKGYAQMSVPGKRGASKVYRVFYVAVFGKPPKGLVLDHKCDNRRCVNPYHLEPVSNAVNCRRGLRTKLTPEIIEEIREFVKSRGYGGQKAAAERFGIHAAHVSRIVRGHRWGEDGALAKGRTLPEVPHPWKPQVSLAQVRKKRG